jgi:hypothetical protein
MQIQRISKESTVFLQCDIQERAKPKIWNISSVISIAKTMAQAAHILNIPVCVTEMMPEKIGRTVAELQGPGLPPPTVLVRKTMFSMCVPEVLAVLRSKKSVVLYGLEAQVCIQQTCLELLDRGFQVFVLADGISSKSPLARSTAIARMRDVGAIIETCESLLLGMIQDRNDPQAKILEEMVMQNRPKEMMPSL